MPDKIIVAISPGELLDKISILQIKSERINDGGRLNNVQHELKLLSTVRDELCLSDEVAELAKDLKTVNEKLWDIEDGIRELEAAADFGSEFIKLARSVYINNDMRAQIKKKINILLGSDIVEEKSYSDYGNG